MEAQKKSSPPVSVLKPSAQVTKGGPWPNAPTLNTPLGAGYSDLELTAQSMDVKTGRNLDENQNQNKKNFYRILMHFL